MRDVIITIVSLAFFFSFRRWSTANFISYLILCGAAFLLHIYTQKWYARKIECTAEYSILPNLLFFSYIFSFFSNGFIVFAALGTILARTSYKTRIGYTYTGLSRAEIGKIAIIGSVFNLLLALILKLFQGFNPLVASFMNVNLWLAVFNLLPIPPLDGSKVVISNRTGWILLFSISLVLALILPSLPIILAVILAIVIPIVLYSFPAVSALAK